MKARPDWLVVARRELMERVRSRWFIVVTLLGPVFMGLLMLLPALAAAVEKPVTLAIVDRGGDLGAPLAQAFGGLGWRPTLVPADTPERALLDQIRDERLDGFLVVPADALASPGGRIVYKGDNATSQSVVMRLHAVVGAAVQSARGAHAGLAPDALAAVLAPVAITTEHTTGGDEATSGIGAFLLGYGIAFILYLAIILYASNVMRSVVLEKSSRVAEIMVAAAKPRALMLGKIVGVGAAGLVQVGVWLVMAALLVSQRDLFGEAAGALALPELDAPALAVALGYFLLGYFFYASLYAAIGAMVTSDQEAQQAQTPVVLLLIVPMVCIQLVANDPRGMATEVLTQLPFSSPVLMPMRYLLGGASLGSLLASLAILALSTWLTVRIAARVYRVGLLMTGKRASLREVWRWLRYR